MSLKQKILFLFLPAFCTFILFTYLNSLPNVQKFYYPFFEKTTLTAASTGQPTIYFKIKEKATTSTDFDEITVLFNTKDHLQKLLIAERKTGKRGAYDYKGFIIEISETYVTPLIFFLSLLIVGPRNWRKKLIGCILGGIIIMVFAYVTVYFRSMSMVADSGVTGIDYHPKELEWKRLMAYLFSNVTTITVVLLTWFLFAFDRTLLSKPSN